MADNFTYKPDLQYQAIDLDSQVDNDLVDLETGEVRKVNTGGRHTDTLLFRFMKRMAVGRLSLDELVNTMSEEENK